MIQQIAGCALWYMRLCDPMASKALNTIERKQTSSTQTTEKWANQLLDYLASHPDAKIRYWQSDMQLIIHSGTSFLTEWDEKSNFDGYFYLRWNQNKINSKN